jgi:hypothetical protein
MTARRKAPADLLRRGLEAAISRGHATRSQQADSHGRTQVIALAGAKEPPSDPADDGANS